MRPAKGTRPPSAFEARAAQILAVLAAWAIAVPWVARALDLEVDVSTRLEVIDHVVPGIVVLVCAARFARARRGSLGRLLASAIAALGGVWILATHVTLVPEALDGVTGWGPALIHMSAGPPIVLLAVWALVKEP